MVISHQQGGRVPGFLIEYPGPVFRIELFRALLKLISAYGIPGQHQHAGEAGTFPIAGVIYKLDLFPDGCKARLAVGQFLSIE